MASHSAQFVTENKRWGDAGVTFWPTDVAWGKYHTLLAMELSTSVWDAVLNAHLAVQQLMELRKSGIGALDSDKFLPTDVLKLAETIHGKIEDGRAALAMI